MSKIDYQEILHLRHTIKMQEEEIEYMKNRICTQMNEIDRMRVHLAEIDHTLHILNTQNIQKQNIIDLLYNITKDELKEELSSYKKITNERIEKLANLFVALKM
jgi:uncharacterized coiled-coil protein SlyX